MDIKIYAAEQNGGAGCCKLVIVIAYLVVSN